MRTLIFLAVVFSSAAFAGGEYQPAKVLEVAPVTNGQHCEASFLGANCTSNSGTQVTLALPGLKVTAQTYPGGLGGGILYLANHPEAVMVGGDVQAAVSKGALEVKCQDGKVLKFKVQRMEKL